MSFNGDVTVFYGFLMVLIFGYEIYNIWILIVSGQFLWFLIIFDYWNVFCHTSVYIKVYVG